MRWAVLASVVLWSCAPSNQTADSPQTRFQRQAIPLPFGAPKVGAPGSLLGSTLVKCPGGGFVAGAPGIGTAWHTPTNTIPSPVGDELGRAVACVAGSTSSEMIAGSDAGVRKALSGGWSMAFRPGIVLSMSSSEDAGIPLLLGYYAGVGLADPSNGNQLGATLAGNDGYGAAVKWYPDGRPRFAVTHAGGNQVAIYDYDAATHEMTRFETITMNVADFGRSLAVGDVHPSPGPELIIGSSGMVYVYSEDGEGPLLELTGDGFSFGASVTTARSAIGLEQLIVGEPESDVVWSFLGDAGTVLASGPTAGEKFGTSVAYAMSELAVGAPAHQSGSGAVYTAPLLLDLRPGEVQECRIGTPCMTSGCTLGDCVGGVFCEAIDLVSSCGNGQMCVMGQCVLPDGGSVVRDGGIDRDAGIEIDGGVVVDGGAVDPADAGQVDGGAVDPVDAGSVDGGVVEPVDAGPVDAGAVDPVDAGPVDPVDAGTTPIKDAGTDEDAGVKPQRDAGVDRADAGAPELMIFTTSGCSESAALPLLALCLALLRRRNR